MARPGDLTYYRQVIRDNESASNNMAKSLDAITDNAPVTNTAADIHDAALIMPTATPLPVVIGHGLQNSPLGRLPGEIRNLIWEMVLVNPKGLDFRAPIVREVGILRTSRQNKLAHYSDLRAGRKAAITCPQIMWALNIMATCQQIRHEVDNSLLDLNDIHIRGVGSMDHEEGQPSIQRSIPLLKNIPSSLGSHLGRVVLWPEPITLSSETGVPFAWDTHEVKTFLSGYSQAIHPFRLLLGLAHRFSRWTESEVQVCGHDAPLTFEDCALIEVALPIEDSVAALGIVDEAIDKRLGLFRQHRAHRICHVRAMLRAFERDLEISRRNMKDAVDFILGVPDAQSRAVLAEIRRVPHEEMLARFR